MADQRHRRNLVQANTIPEMERVGQIALACAIGLFEGEANIGEANVCILEGRFSVVPPIIEDRDVGTVPVPQSNLEKKHFLGAYVSVLAKVADLRTFAFCLEFVLQSRG